MWSSALEPPADDPDERVGGSRRAIRRRVIADDHGPLARCELGPADEVLDHADLVAVGAEVAVDRLPVARTLQRPAAGLADLDGERVGLEVLEAVLGLRGDLRLARAHLVDSASGDVFRTDRRDDRVR